MGTGSFQRVWIAAAALLMLALCGPAARPADAASPADFYKGRTVQIVVGFSAGGGYDLYARVLARHIGRHIPGNPSVIPQNMPGAGSLKAANYLYNVAPKDGSVFGIFDRGLPMERLLGRTGGQDFDATKFTWIGSVTDEPTVCAFSSRSGIRSWQDMKIKPFKVGGAGATADDEIYANVLRNMFHLPLRIVSGYPGRAEMVLSIQRSEIEGLCGWSWSILMSRDQCLLAVRELSWADDRAPVRGASGSAGRASSHVARGLRRDDERFRISRRNEEACPRSAAAVGRQSRAIGGRGLYLSCRCGENRGTGDPPRAMIHSAAMLASTD
jgi:hypothetical protein